MRSAPEKRAQEYINKKYRAVVFIVIGIRLTKNSVFSDRAAFSHEHGEALPGMIGPLPHQFEHPPSSI